MDTQQVFTFGQQSLYMLLMVSAPILLTVLAVCGPWMLTSLVEFVQRTLQSIPSAVG